MIQNKLLQDLIDGNYTEAMLAYLDIQKVLIKSKLHFEKELTDWKQHVEYALYLKKEILSVQGVDSVIRTKTENLLELYGIAVV